MLDYENHKGVPFDKLAEEKFYGPIAIRLLKHGFLDFFITNEKISDLLSIENNKLNIHRSKSGERKATSIEPVG